MSYTHTYKYIYTYIYLIQDSYSEYMNNSYISIKEKKTDDPIKNEQE